MVNNKNRVEQQLKDKIKAYNKQRIVLAIPIVLLLAILLLCPIMDYETLPIRFSMLSSTLFLFCSLFFVLSGRSALLLFLLSIITAASLLVFKQEHFELFLILILINGSTFLISKKTASAFIQSATNEIETINRLKIEASTDRLTHLLNRNGLEQALGTAWVFCKRDKKMLVFF